MKNKKGFTLIELLAIIVILGILMVVAIPAVSKYIDKSKKQAFIATLNTAVDTVKYDIVSGGNNYSFENGNTKYYYLSDIDTEKGKIKSPWGGFIYGKSYISVYKDENTNEYQYEIQVIDEDGNCIELTSADSISLDKIKKYQDAPPVCHLGGVYKGYTWGSIVSFNGSEWYVSDYNSSTTRSDTLKLIKKDPLTNAELGDYASTSISNTMSWYWDENCHSANTYGYLSEVTTSCSTHQSYNDSKIKTFLENVYLETFGENKNKIISITLPQYYDEFKWVGNSNPFWTSNPNNSTANYGCAYWTRNCYNYLTFHVYPVIQISKADIK